MRGDTAAALGHVEKALAVSKGRHTLAHCLKGDCLLALGRPDHAIVAYFKAKESRRDLRAYKGLVEAYLGAQKLKEVCLPLSYCSPRTSFSSSISGSSRTYCPSGPRHGQRSKR
jgi:hypothetical protein